MENLQIPETLVDILKHNKRLRVPRFYIPERCGAIRHILPTAEISVAAAVMVIGRYFPTCFRVFMRLFFECW
jgi:hypothetical protein